MVNQSHADPPAAAQSAKSLRLDATFSALADPTRRAILRRLTAGEATVLELAEPFSISLPAISRHLRVLERAGLISRSRDAQRRPCRIEAAPLEDAAEWVVRCRREWEERLDRLDAYVQEMKQQKKQERSPDSKETKPNARKK